MTYKLIKGKWIGFCDGCESPFKPEAVVVNMFVVDNKKKIHFKKISSTKEYDGWCETCCNNDGCAGSHLMNNIDNDKLIVRKIDGAKVV